MSEISESIRTSRSPRRASSTMVFIAALALVLGLEVWLPGAPTVTTAAVTQAPISSVALVCATSPSFSGTTQLVVSAPDVSRLTATVPSVSTRGRVTLRALMPDRVEGDDTSVAPVVPDPLRSLGENARVTVPQGAAPVAVRGSGSLAPAVVAAATSLVDSGDDRGMVSTTCRRPASTWWFGGASSTLGRLARIVLTNADDLPASVTISIHDEAGDVVAPAGRGIIVPPRDRIELRLDVLAPGLDTAVIRVRATTGRIHAGVLMREVDATTARGVEWLTPMTVAERQVIPVPGSVRSAVVTLLSPDVDATAALWVRDGESRFLPPGLERIELPAGRVVTVALDDTVQGDATLEIDATAALAATLSARVEPRRGTRGDIVNLSAAPALSQAALMTGLRGRDRHVLALTGVDGAASARVSVVADGMEPIVETVDVDGESTIIRELTIPDGVAYVTALVEPVGASASTRRIAASILTLSQRPDGVAGAARVFVARQNTVEVPTVVPAVGMR